MTSSSAGQSPDTPEPNFEGHEPRECGEHRTVGPHRAWCHDCGEWCYPTSPCVRCEIVGLRAPGVDTAADRVNADTEALVRAGASSRRPAASDADLIANVVQMWRSVTLAWGPPISTLREMYPGLTRALDALAARAQQPSDDEDEDDPRIDDPAALVARLATRGDEPLMPWPEASQDLALLAFTIDRLRAGGPS